MNTHGTEEDEVMEEELHLAEGILPTEKSIGCSKEILSSKCRTIKTQLRDVQKQSISNSRRDLEEELEHLEGYSSKEARKERKRLRSILQVEQEYKAGFQRLKRISNPCKQAGAL